MGKTLIIVESPTKIKTLKKFLGEKYKFESSVGHVRDLPARKFGIDVENHFTPQYEVLEGKKDVVAKLKKAAKECDQVFLSPDPDREGEAIAWHIASELPKGTKYKRVTFNEFTKEAVLEALKHPREIDEHLVNAQQARRLLDRIVGYKISPILLRKIQRGDRTGSLSAGRVQSVALKLVVEREREIDAFTPVEYWNLGSVLKTKKESKNFSANLHIVEGKKVEKEAIPGKDVYLIPDEKTANFIDAKLKKAAYKVEKVEKKEKKRNPVPPFITSTLQQEAARYYGMSSAKTMSIAQELYEGVDIGKDGPEGLITYMRTDSVRTSDEANKAARDFVTNTYGKNFLPSSPNKYVGKGKAQDAHEAIRPTHVDLTPEKIERYLTRDQHRLYLLIWRRFVASQMVPAIYDTVSCDIGTSENLVLRATGSQIKFQGFLAVYEEKKDSSEEEMEDEQKILPDLKEGDLLEFISSFKEQSFTKPPARFTEASLIKQLEKLGIGRPSTYAAIMQKILSRSYTTKERNTLKPTELGKIICQMLEENFPKIMNIQFTANMEDDLDKIAETDMDWQAYIKHFYEDFMPSVELAEKEAKVPKIDTDLICPLCGGKVQKIWAKDRYFLGCQNYPDCKYTAPLEEFTYNKEDYDPNFDWDQKCPKCSSEMKVRQSRFGIFLGCSNYPECKGIVNIPKKGEVAPENLPKCPAVGCEGQIVQRRSRFGKMFFSCSNFPDCNVIANSLDELEEKYQNHPKTAYEGKKKYAKKTKEKEEKTPKKAKKTVKKTTKKEAKTKRNQPLYKLSKELAKVVGEDTMSRTEVTKKVWIYIKEHKLQDPENGRKIIPDKLLGAVVGSQVIDMMQLPKHLSKHFVSNA